MRKESKRDTLEKTEVDIDMEFAAAYDAAKNEADEDRDEGYKTEEEEPDELFRVLSDKIEPEAIVTPPIIKNPPIGQSATNF